MCQVPHLTLTLSRSPLLPSTNTQPPNPHTAGPHGGGASYRRAELLASIFRKYDIQIPRISHPSHSSEPDLGVTVGTCASPLRSHCHCPSNHSTKSSPSLRGPAQRIVPPSKAIIHLLNTLDILDCSVSVEVARVRSSVQEVHQLISVARAERSAQVKERAKQRWETKEIGSDFWLGV